MRQNVIDKTERLVLSNVIELRGNFVEIPPTEDGDISYECDYYRTTNPTTTFQQLYTKERLTQLHELLDSTDWIYAKCAELKIDAEIKYPDVVQARKDARVEIHNMEITNG